MKLQWRHFEGKRPDEELGWMTITELPVIIQTPAGSIEIREKPKRTAEEIVARLKRDFHQESDMPRVTLEYYEKILKGDF